MSHRRILGKGQSSSCPTYTPGLYTAEQIDDLVNNQSYIPVASASEFNLIDSGVLQTMGVGTCWEGSYTTGVGQKYVQVEAIDFTGFGTWSSSNSISSFSGIYDGNELDCNNITQTSSLFTSSSAGYIIRNTRFGGTYSISDNTSNGKAPVLGETASGTFANNQYNGTVQNTLSPTNQNLAGLIGIATSVVDLTCSDNVFTGSVTAPGGDFVAFIIGRATDITGTGTFDNNSWLGSTFSAASCSLIAPLSGSLANSNVSNSINSTSFTADESVSGLIGQCNSGTVNISNCSNTGDITSTGGDVGGLFGVNSNATVVVNDSFNTGAIEYTGTNVNQATGGLAGILVSATSTSNITTFNRCRNSGNITGHRYVSGLVGAGSASFTESYNEGPVVANNLFAAGIMSRNNAGSLDDCYNQGSISTSGGGGSGLVDVAGSTTIDNSYSAATIAGPLTGGLTRTGSPTTTNSYWDTTIGPATSGSGTGQTTSALQTPTTNSGIYSAWTIPPWLFNTSVEYPSLSTTP